MFNDIVKIDYVPENAKGENPQFSGKVIMRVPHQFERFKIMKEFGLKIKGKKVEVEKDNFEQVMEIAKIAHIHFVESELIDLETGKPVTESEIFFPIKSENKWLDLTLNMGKFILEMCIGKK